MHPGGPGGGGGFTHRLLDRMEVQSGLLLLSLGFCISLFGGPLVLPGQLDSTDKDWKVLVLTLFNTTLYEGSKCCIQDDRFSPPPPPPRKYAIIYYYNKYNK